MRQHIGNNNLLNAHNNHQQSMYNPSINSAFSNNPLLRRLDDQRQHIMSRTSEMREINDVKRMQKVNTTDKRQMESLRDVLINPMKIEKKPGEVQKAYDLANATWKQDIDVLWKDRKTIKNTPYKIIIPQKTKDTPHGFDYNQLISEPEQLVMHKVTTKDKDKKVFDKNLNTLETSMKSIDKENGQIFSEDKKSEHKSRFEYEHVFYRKNITDTKHHDELKQDQDTYATLKSKELEEGKNARDAILAALQNDETIEVKKETSNDIIDTDSLLESVMNSVSTKQPVKKNDTDSLLDSIMNNTKTITNKNDIKPTKIVTMSQDDELNMLLKETGLI